MKEIKLGKTGFVTLVDDEDFEYLNQFKWYVSKKKNNYASRYFKISKCNYSTLFRLITKLFRRYFRDRKLKVLTYIDLTGKKLKR